MRPFTPSGTRGPAFALASAALFGASTPFAKLLLTERISPVLLAALLYLGAAAALAPLTLLRALRAPQAEAPLRWSDALFFGGMAAPVLLMMGLANTDGATASLLLNLEGLATLAIAWLWLREHTDARVILGAAAILAGAVLLSWQGAPLGGGWGVPAIAAACLCWGIDNNLTRRISRADPLQTAFLKTVTAGSANLFLAVALGAAMPGPAILGMAVVVGGISYGFSLVLFVLALRHLGAGRTGAYYSTAPFIGAALAVPMLQEPVTFPLIAASLLMAFGVMLHLMEAHEHEHAHPEIDHEHRHRHDAHHEHGHDDGSTAEEAHSHEHRVTAPPPALPGSASSARALIRRRPCVCISVSPY